MSIDTDELLAAAQACADKMQDRYDDPYEALVQAYCDGVLTGAKIIGSSVQARILLYKVQTT